MLIKDFGTTMLACTPSYAINMADHVERNRPDYDFRKTKLRAAFFGAEPWTEQMRSEIETRMGIEAFDIYGLSEVIGPGVSCECSAKSGLHVFEDHFYVEIIDPESGEVLPEERRARSSTPRSRRRPARSSATARGTSRACTGRRARAAGRW